MCSLLIDALPEIIDHFPEEILKPGSPMSLKCVVSGNPSPKITWKVDGIALQSINSRMVVGEKMQSNSDIISWLNTSYVQTEDGGTYSCVAQNRGGSAEYSARINVFGELVNLSNTDRSLA